MDEKLKSQRVDLMKLKQEFEKETIATGIEYTDHELKVLMRKIPVAIFNQGNIVSEAMTEYKAKKLEVKRMFNAKLLEANWDSELKSAAERRAFAENSQEYQDLENDLIILEGKYKAAELHYSAYENLFTAIKKIASLVEDQNKAASRGY